MAKRHKHKKKTGWKPSTHDAINFATIRWFALAIEAKCIEIYGTYPELYPDIQAALGDSLSAVGGVNPKKPIADPDPGDCPPGWVPCGADCAPRCMAQEE
jgi:hypothetical protein